MSLLSSSAAKLPEKLPASATPNKGRTHVTTLFPIFKRKDRNQSATERANTSHSSVMFYLFKAKAFNTRGDTPTASLKKRSDDLNSAINQFLRHNWFIWTSDIRRDIFEFCYNFLFPRPKAENKANVFLRKPKVIEGKCFLFIVAMSRTLCLGFLWPCLQRLFLSELICAANFYCRRKSCLTPQTVVMKTLASGDVQETEC